MITRGGPQARCGLRREAVQGLWCRTAGKFGTGGWKDINHVPVQANIPTPPSREISSGRGVVHLGMFFMGRQPWLLLAPAVGNRSLTSERCTELSHTLMFVNVQLFLGCSAQSNGNKVVVVAWGWVWLICICRLISNAGQFFLLAWVGTTNSNCWQQSDRIFFSFLPDEIFCIPPKE